MFSHWPSLFFYQEIYFEAPREKTYLLSHSFAALIWVLKAVFFIGGLKIKFQEKNKNMDWQR
jgi:hypothetical protein